MENTHNRTAIVIYTSKKQALDAGFPYSGKYVYPISDALARAIADEGLARFAEPHCVEAHATRTIFVANLHALRTDESVLAALRGERDAEALFIKNCEAVLADVTGKTDPPDLPMHTRSDLPMARAYYAAKDVRTLRRELAAARRSRDEFAQGGSLPTRPMDGLIAKLLPDIGGQPCDETLKHLALAFGDALPAIRDELRQWHTLWTQARAEAEAKRVLEEAERKQQRALEEAAAAEAKQALVAEQARQTRALLALCDPEQAQLLVERFDAGVLGQGELWQSVQSYVARHQGDVEIVSDDTTLKHDCDDAPDEECDKAQTLSADAYRQAKVFRARLSTLVLPEGVTLHDEGVYVWDVACNVCEVNHRKYFYRVYLHAAGNLQWRVDLAF